MKRIIAILLCLLLILCGTTACKPDTLTNPVVITDPDEQPQEPLPPQDQGAADQPEEQPDEQPEETPDEKTEEQPETEEQPTQAAPLIPLPPKGSNPPPKPRVR